MSTELKQIYDEYQIIQYKYDTLFDDYSTNSNKLSTLREQSSSLIEKVENLINSIANTPKSFNRDMYSIQKNKYNYIPISKLTKQYQKKKFVTCLSTIGFGTVVTILLGKQNEDDDDNSTNMLIYLLVVIFVGIFCFLLIHHFTNKEIKKINKLKEELQKEIYDINLENKNICSLYNECYQLYDKTNQLFYSQIQNKNSNFSYLSEEDQYNLGSLVNSTNSLSKYLSKNKV